MANYFLALLFLIPPHENDIPHWDVVPINGSIPCPTTATSGGYRTEESESRTISSLAQSVVGPKEESRKIDVAGYRHGRQIGTAPPAPTARAWLIASLKRVESLGAGNQTESETRDTLMASDRLARIELSLSLSVECVCPQPVRSQPSSRPRE